MLKGIPKLLSPELLKILCEMGHGDEIVIADGNFPAEALGQRVVRMDGHGALPVLEAVIRLLPLDTYSLQNLILMEVVKGDPVTPVIWDRYRAVVKEHDANLRVGFEERFAFYERAKRAFAVVATSEDALYANIILKKGVIV